MYCVNKLQRKIHKDISDILKLAGVKLYESYIDDSEETIDLNVEEGIDEVQKRYPLINKDDFIKLIQYDPTYKGGTELGKYGKWILNRYYTILKDKISLNKWNEQKKLGTSYPKPLPKTSDKQTHFKKLPKLLSEFDVLNKELKSNIDNIKSIGDLENFIEMSKQNGFSTDDKTQKLLNVIKKCVSKRGKILFRNDRWVVIQPLTLESSMVFGDVTNWCTTSSNGNKYYGYCGIDNMLLFVNIDLKKNKLYQFHFESNQFVDEENNPKSFLSIIKSDKELVSFYQRVLMGKLEKEASKDRNDINFNVLKNVFLLNKELSNDALKSLIKKNGFILQYIKNPPIELQKLAIDDNWHIIDYIKNPSDDIINYTLTKYPESKKFVEKILKKKNV